MKFAPARGDKNTDVIKSKQKPFSLIFAVEKRPAAKFRKKLARGGTSDQGIILIRTKWRGGEVR